MQNIFFNYSLHGQTADRKLTGVTQLADNNPLQAKEKWYGKFTRAEKR